MSCINKAIYQFLRNSVTMPCFPRYAMLYTLDDVNKCLLLHGTALTVTNAKNTRALFELHDPPPLPPPPQKTHNTSTPRVLRDKNCCLCKRTTSYVYHLTSITTCSFISHLLFPRGRHTAMSPTPPLLLDSMILCRTVARLSPTPRLRMAYENSTKKQHVKRAPHAKTWKCSASRCSRTGGALHHGV